MVIVIESTSVATQWLYKATKVGSNNAKTEVFINMEVASDSK